VLLTLEKEGSIEILDVGIYSDGHTVIDIKQKEVFEKEKIIIKKQNNDLEIIEIHDNLSYCSDGTIRFKNEIIDLSSTSKELCILF
jgi:hypothetical protein